MNKLHPDFEKNVLETISDLIKESEYKDFLNWIKETNTRFNRVYRNFFRTDLGNLKKETVVEMFNNRNNTTFILSIFDCNSNNNVTHIINSDSSLNALKKALIERSSIEEQTTEFFDMLNSLNTTENAIVACAEADLIISGIVNTQMIADVIYENN